MTQFDVLGIAGSLRRGAFSRRLLLALGSVAPPELRIEQLAIGHLPMYNQDLEESPPVSWLALRERIRGSDAILIVTPEHNRSVPAALKNVIDIGSRPYGSSAWDGKPCVIISCSPSSLGGYGAHQHVRQSLAGLNMPILDWPEAYIGGVDKLVDEQGHFTVAANRDYCRGIMSAFLEWIRRNRQRVDKEEAALDEALRESFPASDPLPMHPGAD